MEDLERHRSPITAHCYRMLGSLQDAEDVAQETLVRGWQKWATRGADSSLRAWLYAIATRRCLDVLRKRRRQRALAEHTGIPRVSGMHAIEPAPDALFESPQEVVTRREQITLAFMLALQLLSARQRAALLLVDVLEWSVAEAAQALETTPTSINSLLQRARKAVADHAREPEAVTDHAAELRAFIRVWERGDLEGLATLLADDVRLVMPPEPGEFRGRDAVLRFVAPSVRTAPETYRYVATAANGRPAVAIYRRADDGRFVALGISILDVRDCRIAAITRFSIPALFPRFGLAMEYG